MRILITAAIVATTAIGGFAAISKPALAQGAGCGWYAFAGAYKSHNAARRQARKVGGNVFDVDRSNSTNAGQGWYAVGFGPTNRGMADTVKDNFRSYGVRGAYVAQRCFDPNAVE